MRITLRGLPSYITCPTATTLVVLCFVISTARSRLLYPAPAHYGSQATYLPSASSTMTLQDPTWHMDTCASSHLNFNACNLSTIFDKRLFSSVHVGDENSIPVTNTGHSIILSLHRPLHFHNALVTPNIIKNLIYVRQFTRNNNCTIEFDAFGFSVKDFLTRHILLRCDSSGDLYPVTKLSTAPTAFLSTSASTWHQRLGHPGDEVLRSLVSRHLWTSPIVSSSCFPFTEIIVWTEQHIMTWFQQFEGAALCCTQTYFAICLRDCGLWSPVVRFRYIPLVGYTDADWAACPSTRRSTLGYYVFLGDNPLSWSSKCQHTLSRFSVEAEYHGVANVVAKIVWLRNLLHELHSPLSTSTLVYCDNVSAVYMSTNPLQHQWTKHIETDIHFVRDMVTGGQVNVLHVPSHYQYADIFTKGLPSVLLEDFRSSLSVYPPPAQIAREY
ncbi:ribonuclease H-like domain-containing protein [Tanacetum coccineum]